MFKIYTLILTIILFSSCGAITEVQYVGSSYNQTQKVDVFVNEASIRKSYTIMGRGFIRAVGGVNWELVQKRAVKKGKANGADAVLIVQRTAINPLPSISTSGSVDSVGKGIHYNSQSVSYYPVSTWQEILYLKYN